MATEVEGPLTLVDIAERAGLTVPGAQKALDKLVRSGFVSRVGGGRKHQYEIRRSDRLMQMTIALFQDEKNRHEQLRAALKKTIDHLSPPPQAVWIQAVPRVIDEPLMLGMFHESLHLKKIFGGLNSTSKVILSKSGNRKSPGIQRSTRTPAYEM